MQTQKIVVLSGLSGAGKTTGVHALEDQGFYCVDNLPVALLRAFLDLCERARSPKIEKISLVIDIREREFLHGAAEVLQQLRGQGYPIEILFLEAHNDILIRRYQETRRRHPAAAENDSLADAIAKERELLAPLRGLADAVIDTSLYNVHQLRHSIRDRYTPHEGEVLAITLESFGFKYGLPSHADMVLDVRFLPNPYFVEALKRKTGQDPEVSAYALQTAEPFLEQTESLLRLLLPLYKKEGRARVTVAIGCTGGKHRSVAVVENLAKRLLDVGFSPSLLHRDAERG